MLGYARPVHLALWWNKHLAGVLPSDNTASQIIYLFDTALIHKGAGLPRAGAGPAINHRLARFRGILDGIGFEGDHMQGQNPGTGNDAAGNLSLTANIE